LLSIAIKEIIVNNDTDFIVFWGAGIKQRAGKHDAKHTPCKQVMRVVQDVTIVGAAF